MFCMKCGSPLPDDANFCFKCGCDLRNLNQSVGTKSCNTSIRVGSFYTFGRYPQEMYGGETPIEWQVLDITNNDILLISRYGLDFCRYNESYKHITWEQCTLRHWLNNTFYNEAFSEDERRRIKISHLVNQDNPQYHTVGGNDTDDRIFCLSLSEFFRFAADPSFSMCYPTKYARNKGWVGDNGCCWWWLRSPSAGKPGCSSLLGVVISPNGVAAAGNGISDASYLRPALRIFR